MPQLPAIGEEVPSLPAARPELPPIGGEVGQARVPDFRTTNAPPSIGLKTAAYGKDALQLALDALPGAGAVVGGAIATPETMGAGTLTGAALGAGAGRGLRDLIAAGLGLQQPSTAAGEGGKIAMTTAETAVAGVVLPWLWQTIKTPGARVGDVVEAAKTAYDVVPGLKAAGAKLRVLFPKGLLKAPAAVLERPAWQTWQEHLPEAQPSPPVARTTGTSMIPAAVPTAPVAPAAGPPPPVPAPPPVAAPPTMSPQRVLNELAMQARRAGVKLTDAMEQTAIAAVGKGATPAEAVKAVAGAAPTEFAAAQAARQAATTAEPIVPASGKMQLTAAEFTEFRRLTQKGMRPADAAAAVKAMRDLTAQLGTPSAAEAAQTIASRRYKS